MERTMKRAIIGYGILGLSWSLALSAHAQSNVYRNKRGLPPQQMQRRPDVWLTSDIETSYQKLGPNAILPARFRNANGSIKNELVRYANEEKGIYAIPMERPFSGPMKVKRVAEWFPLIQKPGDESGWFGAGNVYISNQNYSIPAAAWTLTGGTPKQRESNNEPLAQTNGYYLGTNNIPVGGEDSFYIRGVYLGGSAQNVGGNLVSFDFIKKTKLTAVIADATGNPILPAIQREYEIEWHAPFEEVVESGDTIGGKETSRIVVPAMPTGGIGSSGQASVENGSVEVWVNPSTWQAIYGLSGTDWTVIGSVVTLATGGVSWGVSAGLISSSPFLGSAIPATALSLTTSGLGYMTSVSTPPASYKKTLDNDWGTWCRAVEETLSFTNDPRKSPDFTDKEPDIFIDPPSLMAGLTRSQLLETSYSNNTLWKSCTMTPYVKYTYEDHSYSGDSYDNHGYAGPGHSSVSIPIKTPEVIGNYTFNTSSPNP